MTVVSEAWSLVLAFKWFIAGVMFTTYAASSYLQYRRLGAFKGPWLAAWTDLWFAKCTVGIGPENHLLLSNICEEYGVLARMGPNSLVTTSPELITRMNAARSPYLKGDWYDGLAMPPGQHNIFSQRDEEMHSRRRAQMADGFAGKTNKSIEPSIDKHIQNLISLIREKYISTPTSFKPIDMARRVSFFTLDVITDIAFGQPFGNLKNDTDMYEYIELTEEMLPMMAIISNVPLFRTMFTTGWVSKLLFPSDKSEKGIGKMVGIARQLVQKRYAKKEIDQQDMLSSFVSRGMSETDLVAESILSILAGSDTTATALRSIILHVTTYAPVLAKLQTEIDSFITIPGSSYDTKSTIKDSDAKLLPYMQAVIKEGLRIFPPVTGMMTKMAPPEGDTVELDIHGTGAPEKVFIPGGTKISIAQWGIQRSKATFGEDAELFRPERWLIDDHEEVTRLERVVDLNFGYGKYQCLGRPIAWMELNKCVFELFRHFDFQIVDPANPWKSHNCGLWLQSEMWLRVTERTLSAPT
ncbi:cytochrome P450 [Cadophora sp. DSE1049]|nr:cytochrome P450 [Cadophora sp. DSE1049]